MTEQKRSIDLIPMKKLFITIGKSLLFFIGWALLASFLPIPDSSDGGVSLADDYPNLCVTEFTGNALLSGGEFKIEGSIVVSLLNTALALVFLFLVKKTSNNSTEKR